MKGIAAIALGALMLGACKKDQAADCEDPVPESSHVAYFGFTLVDTYWDDPLDSEVKDNYSDEVYTFSNTADIIAVNPTDDLVGKMEAMAAWDMKALIHLNELFFELVGADAPSGNEYALRSNYQERWDSFVSTNNLISNQELVQVFYLGEEPTWNGISFQELSAACDYIEMSIPQVPILIIEAYPAIDDLVVPLSADWVGFDHYFIADPQNDAVFLDELALLKTKRSSTDQKLVLIMDAHYIEQGHGGLGGISVEGMKAVATSYYDLALTETDVVGLFGYCWPGGFDLPDALGARQLPAEVQAEYSRIGKAITGKE